MGILMKYKEIIKELKNNKNHFLFSKLLSKNNIKVMHNSDGISQYIFLEDCLLFLIGACNLKAIEGFIQFLKIEKPLIVLKSELQHRFKKIHLYKNWIIEKDLFNSFGSINNNIGNIEIQKGEIILLIHYLEQYKEMYNDKEESIKKYGKIRRFKNE